jgi:hypothetical protein
MGPRIQSDLGIPDTEDAAREGGHDLKVRIYLAGAVPKGGEDRQAQREMWSAADERLICDELRSARVETVNPNRSGVSRADFYANFGCDLYLVDSSDVVFVDGRGKRGIGVGAEMMFAQMRGTRVVAICPDESAYRRRDVHDMFGEDLDEWIHPFVFGLADHIAASLEEAIAWVEGWVRAGRPQKAAGEVDRAIDYYRSIAEPPDPEPQLCSEPVVGITAAPHRPAAARRA